VCSVRRRGKGRGDWCWPGGRVQWKWPGCLANKLTDNGSWQCTCLPLDICRLPWNRMPLPPPTTYPPCLRLCLFVLPQDDNDGTAEDGGGKRQGPCCREGRRRGCTTPTPTAADVTHSWSFCWVNRLKNLCCLQKQNLPSPSFDSRHLPQAQWNNIIKPGSLSPQHLYLMYILKYIIIFITNKQTSLLTK